MTQIDKQASNQHFPSQRLIIACGSRLTLSMSEARMLTVIQLDESKATIFLMTQHGPNRAPGTCLLVGFHSSPS